MPYQETMAIKQKLNSLDQKELVGNILSFDFGEKRIGVAVGNNLTKSSHPLETINTPLNSDRYKIIEKLVRLLFIQSKGVLSANLEVVITKK